MAKTSGASNQPTTESPVKNKPTEEERIQAERDKIAHAGFFLRAANFILARTPFTSHKYQNWTASRRILVGWLLWLFTVPLIPIAAGIFWYMHDPEGFKKSPWAKGLIALAVAWTVYGAAILTNQPVTDVNGKFSPFQTAPNGEVAGKATVANTASQAAQEKVKNQTESKPSNGQKFDNCTQAFEAGVFNIKRSDSAYQQKLDRDKDGIAC